MRLDTSIIVKEYTDNEIIECLKNRQSYVVRYLSDRYMPMIRLMVFRMGGTLEDAKDIFQDGLIIMLEKIDNGDFVLTCKFRTFLYVVCENERLLITISRAGRMRILTMILPKSRITGCTRIFFMKFLITLILHVRIFLNYTGRS
jgi:hypothetical protein